MVFIQMVKHWLNIQPSDSTPRYLGIYPRELKTYVHIKTGAQMCTYSSITLNSQKVETTVMSVNDKQINKMQPIRTMEYYLAIQRNEILIHRTIRKLLKMCWCTEERPLKMEGEGSCLHAKERGFRRNEICQHLKFGLAASRP